MRPLKSRRGSETVLSQRALNRALLERQHLLRRRDAAAVAEIEHLVGMQAQVPSSPYVGLWTRLTGFQPEHLANLINQRRAVRLAMMRSTIHLVSARDCLALRPVMAPLLERSLHTSTPFGRNLAGMDMPALLAAGRQLLDQEPRTLGELGRLLHQRWPDRDPDSLAYAISHLVPLVQVPPRGIWGERGLPKCATAEGWLGKPLANDASPNKMILRYLAAFGPATVADIQAWSGLKALPAVVERLRPRLRIFSDERGRELFDLPDGPVPDPDSAAPPRFLPEFDNLVIGHDDRTRVIAIEHRYVVGNGMFLLDGFVAGTWSIKRQGNNAALRVEPFKPLRKADRTGLMDEGTQLLEFAAAEAKSRTVEFR